MSLFLFTEKEKWVRIKEILSCHWDHPFNLARLSQRANFILEIKKHPKGVQGRCFLQLPYKAEVESGNASIQII